MGIATATAVLTSPCQPPVASSTPSREETLVAAGIGQRPDDPEMPCLTIRMWVIGIAFCLIGSGVNTLFTFRFPAVTLSQSAIQLLSYPVGRVWHMAVPDWGITVLGERYSLNPGPFNYKENILIYILANLSFLTRLSADVLTEQRVFYGLNLGWGFEITITLATLLFGFALAGLSRSIIVEPPRLMWPGVLGNTALNSALHPVEKTYKSEYVTRFDQNSVMQKLTNVGFPFPLTSPTEPDTGSFSWRLLCPSSGTGSPTSSFPRSAILRGCAGLRPKMPSSIKSLA